ncbi:MAG: hypothetical protein Q3962_09440 [Corynebacterium sp.]|nr:hypothetical protein [Corynebacterium sp.]
MNTRGDKTTARYGRALMAVLASAGLCMAGCADNEEDREEAELEALIEALTSPTSEEKKAKRNLDTMRTPVEAAESYVDQKYSFKPAEENPYEPALRTAKFWIDEQREIIESAHLVEGSRLNLPNWQWMKWADEKAEIKATFELLDASSIYSPNVPRYVVNGIVHQYLNTPGKKKDDPAKKVGEFTVSFVLHKVESEPDVWKIKDISSLFGKPATSL